jgi:hypothetical protein
VRQKINFAIREMCELRALCVILDYCTEVGVNVLWNIFMFPVNTDLLLFPPKIILKRYKNIKLINFDPNDKLIDKKIYGFKANIAHKNDQNINSVIDLYEITTCKRHIAKNTIVGLKKPNIVIGSVKIKSPVEDFQIEMWKKISQLPYNIIVVPRHPFTAEELSNVNIPKKINLRNTMGELEDLYAQADLTIMGKIFGITRYDYNTRDHDVLESTINSNTICGMYSDIPLPYLEFYQKSGLVHRFYDWKDIFEHIDKLIKDPLLPGKIKKRVEWIEKNRKRYLPCALKILGIK